MHSAGFVECYEMDCKYQRSQSRCWIKDNKLFVDGDVSANRKNIQALDDLHFLDFKDYKWYKLRCNNVVDYLMEDQIHIL